MALTPNQMMLAMPGALTLKVLRSLIASGKNKLVIKDTGEQKFQNEDQPTPVLYFEGTAKYLTMNPKRSEQLAEVIGADNDPVGREIAIVIGQGRNGDMAAIAAP